MAGCTAQSARVGTGENPSGVDCPKPKNGFRHTTLIIPQIIVVSEQWLVIRKILFSNHYSIPTNHFLPLPLVKKPEWREQGMGHKYGHYSHSKSDCH